LTQKQQVANLYTQYFYQGGVSFRNIPKVFKVARSSLSKTLEKVPHFTSAINWSLRLGLGLLNSVKPIDEPWVAIIDHTIGNATNKGLVVLRVPLNQFLTIKRAIQLKDCECIGIKVVEKVTGESTALDLKEIFEISGNPVFVIKDCDAALKKGVELWSGTQNTPVHVVEDIGHVAATALKSEFNNDKDFKAFITVLSSGAKRLRQTVLSFFAPLKLRTKGRFQSIGRLAKWAKKIRPILSQRGRAKTGSTLDKLRKAFPNLTRLKTFVERFGDEIEIIAKMMEVLKNKGLTQETHDLCQQLLAKLPIGSKTKSRLEKWLEQHIGIRNPISGVPLLTSSDIIESLFGKFKYFLERRSNKDINRSILLIPGMCGSLGEVEMAQARELITYKALTVWTEENLNSQYKKEKAKFSNKNDAVKVA
jgi:hypothetical protein